MQELMELLRELDLAPGIGREGIEFAASDIWQKIATGPGASESPRETVEALQKIARAWRKLPTDARTSLVLHIGAYLESRGLKCSSRDPNNFNSWPIAVLSDLLDDLPLILEGEARRSRARVRRGSPGRPWERYIAKVLLDAYLELAGSLPGDSDLSTVKTPYAHLVERTFESLGLDGWAYHGREAVRAARGKVKKRRERRE